MNPIQKEDKIQNRNLMATVILSALVVGVSNHLSILVNRGIGTDIKAQMNDRYTGTDADMDWKAQRKSNPSLPSSRPSASK